MNLDSFYKYLEQPNTLNSQSLAELNELINHYPYFQSARLLYLKNLHLLNDYRYNEELRTVSAYAGNRQILYELINDKKIKINESQEINYSVSDKDLNNTIETVTETKEETKEISIEKPEIIEVPEPANLIENNFQKEEIKDSAEEINIIPDILETTKEKTAVEEETISVITENNILPNISEEIKLTDNNIVEEKPQTEPVIETAKEKEIIIEEKQLEINLPIVELKSEKTAVVEKSEPVKESVADMILKKVAAIHAERAKEKEQVKNNIEVKQIIATIQPQVNEEHLLDAIIAEAKAKSELKPESIILINEDKKTEENKAEITTIIEDVTADSFIAITEEEDLTNYNEIQETEYLREEIKEIEPVSLTKNFKHVLIISDEKENIIAKIKSEPTNEIESTKDISFVDHDTMYTIETDKAEVSTTLNKTIEIITNENFEAINDSEKDIPIIKDYKFEETPLFSAPAYDINSLLEKEPVLSKETLKTENIEQVSMPFEKWLDFISTDSKKVSKPKTHPDLIEAFIKSEPRLSFKIASETSNLKQKEPLISHNEIELVSESLADIYAKQGLTEKAIIMYEKLALQYPEKNIYFANLISKINKQNSNQ